MFRFVYAKSTFKVLGSRLLTHTTKFSSRFTREGLRDRLRNSSNNNAPIPKQQSINAQHPTFRPDSIPVRPVKDLWKALGFTAVVSFYFFNIVLILHHNYFFSLVLHYLLQQLLLNMKEIALEFATFLMILLMHFSRLSKLNKFIYQMDKNGPLELLA